MRDLWLDTDMGFDDLAAWCMLADRVAGVSVVAGNVTLDQAVRNACAARATFGWAVPVHAGARAPLAGALVTADYVLGQDGMPGTGRKLPATTDAPDSSDAVAALSAWIGAGGVEVIALGPLTNIALLVQARPDLAARIRVTWMGGTASGGNHSAAAEFNAAIDPEAVDVVLTARVDLAMVGLDCCRQVSVTMDDVAAIRVVATERGQLLADLLEGYVGIAEGRPMALYDPVAAAVLIDPSVVEFRAGRVDMELAGQHTRGMTVVEWRPHRASPNARVAVRADAERVRTLFLNGLVRAAQA
ncbi:nucleoside hydrolase [Falsirhodobacter sp. 20TX0035]|uniref:nucleoside hydrolase n=1 Tax=Falsirhodobacter sp. 20TX0035 TaxID=3022019 RepID=UPI00232B4B7F|nr:nucleoside hydrolase [Falsirhodobacter sp. 20TX0035]MDB6453529.1 nucleoside hydrolase [Falsirhodobacter sp. 20TX0035]